MDGLAIIGGIVIAAAAQKLNTYKSVSTETVKLTLVLIGLGFYALGSGLPSAWWGPPLSAYLGPAIVWALALPGAASLIGIVPGMKTNSVELKSSAPIS